MPAKVLETMCVKTEEVDRRSIGGSLANVVQLCESVGGHTYMCQFEV
jgi:hypothetical protein